MHRAEAATITIVAIGVVIWLVRRGARTALRDGERENALEHEPLDGTGQSAVEHEPAVLNSRTNEAKMRTGQPG